MDTSVSKRVSKPFSIGQSYLHKDIEQPRYGYSCAPSLRAQKLVCSVAHKVVMLFQKVPYISSQVIRATPHRPPVCVHGMSPGFAPPHTLFGDPHAPKPSPFHTRAATVPTSQDRLKRSVIRCMQYPGTAEQAPDTLSSPLSPLLVSGS